MPRINPYRMFIGAITPNWLSELTNISPGAKLCYGRLCQYAGADGVAYPKVAVLAKGLGVNERSVKRYLRELRDAGFIEIEVKGNQMANRYYFHDHPAIQARSTRTDLSPSTRPDSSPCNRTDSSRCTRTDSSPPLYKERRESIEENQFQFDPLQIPLPESLQSEAGRTAWKDWVKCCQSNSRPLTCDSAQIQLKTLARCKNPIFVLERAAGSRWQGLNVREDELKESATRPPLHTGDRPY